MSFLNKVFGGDATAKAGKKNAADLAALRERGMGYIDTGEAKAEDYLDDIPGMYDPYIEGGADASAMLDKGLGLAGPEGSAEALEVLRASPGYNFEQEAAAQAAARGASAGGKLASGNLLTELQDRAQGIADGRQGSWLDRLLGRSNQGLTAVGGAAAGKTNLANLAQTVTGQRVGFDSSVTGGLNANRNNVASAKEQGLSNMWDVGTKFLGFLHGQGGS